MSPFMQKVQGCNEFLTDEDRDALVVAVYQILQTKQGHPVPESVSSKWEAMNDSQKSRVASVVRKWDEKALQLAQ